MKRFVLIALVGWLALATAAGAWAGAKGHDDPRVSFVGINERGRERQGVHFEPKHLNILVVVVSWRALAGARSQRVELVTPDGSVYQQFTTDIGKMAGRARLETRVPVAGTWITQYQIFGEWTVNVYLDEETTPVATANVTLSH